jgi:LysM repeat protein
MTTIARRNNTTVEDILRDNPHIKNPNVVRVGDELKVSEPEPYKPKVRSFSEIQKLEEELNGKSDTEIIHHYYTSKNLDKNYIIDDKKGSLAIYNRGRLIKRWKAAHGKNAGSDDMTVTYKDVDGEIKNGEGNLSTPAGYY